MISATWIQTKTSQIRHDGADVEDSLGNNSFNSAGRYHLVGIQIQD